MATLLASRFGFNNVTMIDDWWLMITMVVNDHYDHHENDNADENDDGDCM